MTDVFAVAVETLFGDPALGRDATYTPAGGDPVAVRAIERQPEPVSEFGDAQIVRRVHHFEVRTDDLPAAARGDTLTIDGASFQVQSDPVREAERRVWILDTRPA